MVGGICVLDGSGIVAMVGNGGNSRWREVGD